jgi:hypothetical protein
MVDNPQPSEDSLSAPLEGGLLGPILTRIGARAIIVGFGCANAGLDAAACCFFSFFFIFRFFFILVLFSSFLLFFWFFSSCFS